MIVALLALLIGVVAGLRTFTAPAAVSWAAHLGWLPLGGTLARLHGLCLDAVDPSRCWRWSSSSPTSCRRHRAARCRCSSAPASSRRRLSGATIGASAGWLVGWRDRRHRRRGDRHLWRGMRRGATGGGVSQGQAGGLHRGRRRDRRGDPDRDGGAMSRRFDAIIIGAGQAGPAAGRAPDRRRHDGGDHRAQAVRRHLRQYRLHADQDAGRQRLCGASRPSRRRLRRHARRRRRGSTWRGSRRAPTRCRRMRAAGVETMAARHERLHGHHRPCPLRSRRTRSRSATRADRAAHLHQCRRPRRRAGSARHRHGAVPDQQHHPRARSRAAAPRGRRRQLYRARIRADVPAVRRRGDGGRDGPAADRARGRGRVAGDPRDPRRRGHRGAHRRGMHQPGAACRGRVGRGRVHRGRARGGRLARAAGGRAGGRIPTISVSRRPASRSIHAATSQVDEGLATNVPGIWALGDCNGRGAFTHTAYNDFEIVAANLLDGETPSGQRPHSGLCALHRSAAGPGRHDRDAGAVRRPQAADRQRGR